MTYHEKLIEEAAKAINQANEEYGEYAGSGSGRWEIIIARAVLAVFEKAHTPTDDERKQLSQEVFNLAVKTRDKADRWANVLGEIDLGDEAYADAELLRQAAEALAAGFRRSDIPEPSAGPKHDESCAEWCNHCTVCGVGTRYGSRCPEHYQNQPQGEPSDAQVLAALDAFFQGQSSNLSEFGAVSVKGMRAALRAAGEVRS